MHLSNPVTYLVPLIFGVTTSLLAQGDPVVAPGAVASTNFENPGLLRTEDFLGAEWMNGALHQVSGQCYNDGLHNTYLVESQGRTIQVTGTDHVRQRIREIYAIDQLRQISASSEFTNGLKEAGKGTLGSVTHLVTHPVSTVKNVPKGASRFFGGVGESLKGGSSETEVGGIGSALGVERAKVAIALDLHVDPYSPNQELQELLTSAARAKAGGGLVVRGGTAAVGGAAGTALSVVHVNKSLEEALRSSDPNQLRIENRKKLFALGLDRAQADQFLMHPWYSPWQETIIVNALSEIGGNPAAFLAAASRAAVAEDAFYFQRLAMLLLHYHTSTDNLAVIGEFDGVITARDKSGRLVVPVSMDYALWTPALEARVQSFSADVDAKGGNPKNLVLMTDGRVSPSTAAGLRQQGITMYTEAMGPGAR